MRLVVQIVAVLYSFLFGFLLLGSSARFSAQPEDLIVIVILAVPVLSNWLLLLGWKGSSQRIRQFALVVAISYSIFFGAVLILGIDRKEYGTLIGVLVLSPPIAMNYLSYRRPCSIPH